jgi:hypothetical protein
MKIIKNFLDKDSFIKINELLLSSNFPWFYQSKLSSDSDTSDNFFFCHNLYKDSQQQSLFFDLILTPILKKLNFKNLLRAKINCYTKNPKEIKTSFHVDSTTPHTVCLYSINTNNGYTLFKKNKKIYSIENQMLIFDGKLEHCSVAQTDEKIRVNININVQ